MSSEGNLFFFINMYNFSFITFFCLLLLILSFYHLIRSAFIKYLNKKSKSPISYKYLNNGTFVLSTLNFIKLVAFVLIVVVCCPYLNIIVQDILSLSNPLESSKGLYTVVMECSSPTRGNEAFKGTHLNNYSQSIKEIDSLNTYTKPELDFSKLDSLLAELQNNIGNSNKIKIENLKQDINKNIEELVFIGDKTRNSFGMEINQLIKLAFEMSRLKEFQDLKETLAKFSQSVSSDLPKPSKDLLDSDPVKYWKESITYANRVQNKSANSLNLLKTYVKGNSLLSPEEKSHLLSAIKNLNRKASIISEIDKEIFKKQIHNNELLNKITTK